MAAAVTWEPSEAAVTWEPSETHSGHIWGQRAKTLKTSLLRLILRRMSERYPDVSAKCTDPVVRANCPDLRFRASHSPPQQLLLKPRGQGPEMLKFRTNIGWDMEKLGWDMEKLGRDIGRMGRERGKVR